MFVLNTWKCSSNRPAVRTSRLPTSSTSQVSSFKTCMAQPPKRRQPGRAPKRRPHEMDQIPAPSRGFWMPDPVENHGFYDWTRENQVLPELIFVGWQPPQHTPPRAPGIGSCLFLWCPLAAFSTLLFSRLTVWPWLSPMVMMSLGSRAMLFVSRPKIYQPPSDGIQPDLQPKCNGLQPTKIYHQIHVLQPFWDCFRRVKVQACKGVRDSWRNRSDGS